MISRDTRKTLVAANEIVKFAAGMDIAVTPLKLQKLLFYVKSWGLVAGRNVVPGAFEKWKHGPVCREVYDHYKQFGRSHVPVGPDIAWLDGDDAAHLKFVVQAYGRFSAIELSSMTHRERPWKAAQMNAVISDESILAYYSAQPFADNFPLGSRTFVRLPVGDAEAAFSMDMDDEAAARYRTVDDLDAYIRRLKSEEVEVEKAIRLLQERDA